jgi:hypothetical protein
LNQILRRQTSRSHYGSKVPAVTVTVFKYRNKIGKIAGLSFLCKICTFALCKFEHFAINLIKNMLPSYFSVHDVFLQWRYSIVGRLIHCSHNLTYIFQLTYWTLILKGSNWTCNIRIINSYGQIYKMETSVAENRRIYDGSIFPFKMSVQYVSWKIYVRLCEQWINLPTML